MIFPLKVTRSSVDSKAEVRLLGRCPPEGQARLRQAQTCFRLNSRLFSGELHFQMSEISNILDLVLGDED